MTNKTPSTALKVDSLSKAFKHVRAIDNISFSIESGDVFAFLIIRDPDTGLSVFLS